MIEFRAGNYTFFNHKTCKLYEQRHESHLAKEEMQFSICYDISQQYGFENFHKHPFEEMLCKNFYAGEILNAFFVQTYGLYEGIKVKVFEYKPNPNLIYITTEDKIAFEKHSFCDMTGHYGKDIKITDLEKLWEERSPSEYDLPMPKGLELIKEIDIS